MEPSAILLVLILTPFVAVVPVSIVVARRARAGTLGLLDRNGFRVVRLERRVVRRGPFQWRSRKDAIIYRAAVIDGSGKPVELWVYWWSRRKQEVIWGS